tara:strand:- start:117 stop:353 length:237 start_codon:yes stop_codon:yes gene_type:complete
MTECAKALMEYNVDCPCKECRLWIDFKEDSNCTLIAVKKQKTMTLREVADRLGISFVRVKQIQDSAHKKMLKRLNNSK